MDVADHNTSELWIRLAQSIHQLESFLFIALVFHVTQLMSGPALFFFFFYSHAIYGKMDVWFCK